MNASQQKRESETIRRWYWASHGLMSTGLSHFCIGLLVPPMKAREIARVPGLSKSRRAEIPVRPDLAAHGPQVAPEINHRWSPPEPIPVVDAVDHQARLKHERVRDHRIVIGVGVLLYVEVFLNLPVRVGEKGPLSADGRTKLLERVVIVSGNRRDLRVGHRNLWVKRCEFQMLLVLLGAVMAASECED